MILVSIVFSVANGNIAELSSSLFSGAETAVTLSISLLGGMCFWLGISELVTKSGINKIVNRLLMPAVNFLFPKFKENEKIKEKICLNITANLLGLGNAATPLGIEAVSEMAKHEKNSDKPSKEIILFVIINTASLQLLPTNMANLRSSYGSNEPFSILVPVWIVSLSVMLSVIIFAKILEKRGMSNHGLRR